MVISSKYCYHRPTTPQLVLVYMPIRRIWRQAIEQAPLYSVLFDEQNDFHNQLILTDRVALMPTI